MGPLSASVAGLAFPATTLIAFPLLMSSMGRSDFARLLVLLAVFRMASSVDLGICFLASARVGTARSVESQASVLYGSVFRVAGWWVSLFIVGEVLVGLGGRVGDLELGAAGSEVGLVCGAALFFQVWNVVSGVAQVLKLRSWNLAGSFAGSAVYLFAIVSGWAATPGLVIGALVAQYATASSFVALVVIRRIPFRAMCSRAGTVSMVSMWMQLTTVVGMAALQAPVLIGGAVLNDDAVVVAGVAQQYGAIVRLGAASLSGYFVAEISRRDSGYERSSFVERARIRWKWFMAVVSALVALTVPWTVDLLMGGMALKEVTGASVAAVAGSAVICSTLVDTSYLRSIGFQREEARFVLVLLAGTLLFCGGASFVTASASGIWLGAGIAAICARADLARRLREGGAAPGSFNGSNLVSGCTVLGNSNGGRPSTEVAAGRRVVSERREDKAGSKMRT